MHATYLGELFQEEIAQRGGERNREGVLVARRRDVLAAFALGEHRGRAAMPEGRSDIEPLAVDLPTDGLSRLEGAAHEEERSLERGQELPPLFPVQREELTKLRITHILGGAGE